MADSILLGLTHQTDYRHIQKLKNVQQNELYKQINITIKRNRHISQHHDKKCTSVSADQFINNKPLLRSRRFLLLSVQSNILQFDSNQSNMNDISGLTRLFADKKYFRIPCVLNYKAHFRVAFWLVNASVVCSGLHNEV